MIVQRSVEWKSKVLKFANAQQILWHKTSAFNKGFSVSNKNQKNGSGLIDQILIDQTLIDQKLIVQRSVD